MRYCNHCKARLLTKRGTPDYRKHFCGRDCKNADAKEKMAARRKVVHGRKCRLCGRKAIAALPLLSGVSRDNEALREKQQAINDRLDGTVRLRSERPEEEVEVPQ